MRRVRTITNLYKRDIYTTRYLTNIIQPTNTIKIFAFENQTHFLRNESLNIHGSEPTRWSPYNKEQTENPCIFFGQKAKGKRLEAERQYQRWNTRRRTSH